jgi:glyoxylase-like metal-dependent hydrolase (beta-lactamase superfamily II)
MTTLRRKTWCRWIRAFPLIALIISFVFFACKGGEKKQTETQTSEIIQPQKWWEKLPRPIYASLERIQVSQDWYEVYRLTEGTYAIYEPFQFEEAISYLVLGKDRGVVIDTGTGIGDLNRVIKELTDLPVSVVNTHSHWDHIGDNHQFQEIACYNHPACVDKLLAGVGHSRLESSIKGDSIWKPLPQDFDADSWEIPSVEPTVLLEDGDVIDLGGRTLEVIYTPGHSPGSICLLDKINRLLFSGDTFFPGPLYAYSEDVDIDEYIASIDKLESKMDEYDYLCSGHNDPWVQSEVISRVADAFQKILAGEGEYKQDGDIRRYYFNGFDILIRTDMITK